MGARLSTQNRKRVAAKLNGIKKKEGSETNTNASCATLSTIKTNTSQQSFDSLHGRKYHNEQTSTYWFPNDDEEIDRLVGVSFFLFK